MFDLFGIDMFTEKHNIEVLLRVILFLDPPCINTILIKPTLMSIALRLQTQPIKLSQQVLYNLIEGQSISLIVQTDISEDVVDVGVVGEALDDVEEGEVFGRRREEGLQGFDEGLGERHWNKIIWVSIIRIM
jgi:hypothetical protein